MGTCRRQFRCAFSFFHQIVDFQQNCRLYITKLFCLVALLVFEKHCHFGSDTSDCMLNSSCSIKTTIRFPKGIPSQIVALFS